MDAMEKFLIQVAALLVGLFVVWVTKALSNRFLGSSRANGRRRARARHHFVNGAQLLAKARTADKPSDARSFAKEASAEADKAIALDPLDAACHVLKSLALEEQGLFPAALRSMDTALSPEVSGNLSPPEMADALMKRGGLLLATSKGRKNLDAAIADFQKSLEIVPDNAKVLCMLGRCYEKSRMYAEAEKAYERVLALEPGSDEACAGMARLRP
ncbi:hypothetical protein KP509_31G035300 [Ceratopteris richardii]|uniref:Uncharacterized protein n=1 Tax=Ceratopteris richardii TaxID=49495 RepID=A0A8T2QXQ4_CERRI|nr:hypothetical protein KP509_31G035300 [Ceratopteris richardii]KAH7288647.1 hypothetical protein KP509_31G035300 [Ceratopteris richardii]KAH7288648.1 hypothetical protein KP509_31G035300 [Ceratopteris richardii]